MAPRMSLMNGARFVGFVLVACVLYFWFLLQPDKHDLFGGIQDTGILNKAQITAYIKAILQSHDNGGLPRLNCPTLNTSRYKHLLQQTEQQHQYFFAINLRECLPLLPRLLGSLVEAIHFLGPERCTVSIVEGNSADGTAEVLAALAPILRKSFAVPPRIHIVIGTNDIDPLNAPEGQRFTKLADLRNQALKPLLDLPAVYGSDNTTVVFLNDVAICTEDILELVHQRRVLGADMTCAFDWTYGAGEQPMFYDSYIARGINGDLFFEIPPETASLAAAQNLFWNEPHSKDRFDAHQPFQVFACWNGAVAFTARPLVERKVCFRASREDLGECFQGEPQLFCKDLWFHGYGKIAVVPSVNLEYSIQKGKKIKESKGYASQWTWTTAGEAAGSKDKGGIEWLPPPEQVKCMPTFDRQFWRPWNETLPLPEW